MFMRNLFGMLPPSRPQISGGRPGAFESEPVAISYEPLKFENRRRYGSSWEFEEWGHQMARFRSEFQITKILTDLEC
jgi:hypothetical protein